MNNPDDIKILISAYIDGEATPQEKDTVEEALRRDPALRRYYEDLLKLSQRLKQVETPSLSPDGITSIKEKIQREDLAMKTPSRTHAIRITTSLATAAVVLVIGMQVYKTAYLERVETMTDNETPQTIAADKRREGVPAVQSAGQQPGIRPAADALGTAAERQKITVGRQAVTAASTMAAPASPNTVRYESYYLSSDYSTSDRIKVSEKAIGGLVIYPLPDYDSSFNTEQYDRITDNPFVTVTDHPLSTFSIDVDTASYSNVRRFLQGGQLPPKDAVRIEEMINYFDYDYPQPREGEPFSITTEVNPCPWENTHQLMIIGLKGKEMAQTPPSNLVFLIDVSGSMNQPNKLPLLKEGFKRMVNQLQPQERVAIVTYAGAAGLVLESTPASEKHTIISALDRLQAGGSTAGGEGIELAYKVAKDHFITDGNNRVILATDGDFNVGVSSDGELTRIIEEKRKDGIFLTVLGFGTGNTKDSRMEKLADTGNGNYYYIDTLQEANKVLVRELGSMLFAIAKDVKIQIEFNPQAVKAYRLIGYENRILAKEDFNDDAKDAGELGAGHTVTALYEIVLAGSADPVPAADELKYQKITVKPSSDLLTVKLRYKEPDQDKSRLLTKVIPAGEIVRPNELRAPSRDYQWAAAVAEFGLLLRDSPHKGTANLNQAINRARAAMGEDRWGYRAEAVQLMQTAEPLIPAADGTYQYK